MPTTGKLPPGPRGLPVLGSLLSIAKAPHQDVARIVRKYGDVCMLRMGSVPTVFISHPDLMREAFSKTELSERWLTGMMRAMSHDGINLALANFHGAWKQFYDLFSEGLLSPERSRLVSALYMAEVLDDLVEQIDGLCDSGRPMEPHSMIPRGNLAMMARSIFGKSPSDTDEFERKLEDQIDAVFYAIGTFKGAGPEDYIPWLKRFPNGAVKEAVRQAELMDGIVDFLLDGVGVRPEHDPNNPACLADILLAGEKTGELDRASSCALVSDLFGGGLDNIGHQVVWLLLLLANRPRVQDRVYEELASVVPPDRAPGIEDKPSLPYLFGVIAETMRYKTVNPFGLPHRAAQTCEVGGFTIPAGTQVLGNMYYIHHDERFWDSPYDFIPERFMPSPDGTPAPGLTAGAFIPLPTQTSGNFIPFGAGLRACPDRGFSEIAIWLQASRLLHRYHFEPYPNAGALPEDEVFRLSVTSKPYSLKVSRR